MRGDQELAAREATASPPAVAITSPQAGESWTGAAGRTIAWNASDADGDALTYTLQYSSDGGVNWLPLRVALREMQSNLQTSQIAGGAKVHFRVLSSDGWHTGIASVGPLEVIQSPKLETAAEIDFRMALVGGFVDRKLLLKSTGNGPLVVTAIESDSPAFEVLSSATPLVIPAGSGRDVALRFAPAVEGAVQTTLAITTESGEKVFAAMKGNGITKAVPDIEVTPATLDFGKVAAGQNKEMSLVVRNHGPAPLLVLSLAADNARFSPLNAGSPFLLEAGTARTVKVRFQPSTASAETGVVTIQSNDAARRRLTASLAGNR